jgi:hypothetical protein
MVAEAASGSKTPKEAAERAQKRASVTTRSDPPFGARRPREPLVAGIDAAPALPHRSAFTAVGESHEPFARLRNNRNTLGLVFMLPAGALLLLFLTYPLGLGTWLGFTDAKIGRAGEWVGLENYEFLVGDSVTQAGALQHAVLHDHRQRSPSSPWACGWRCC